MLFPQRFIDDLRLQANILQIVQEYVSLKRAGATYKGVCPFHSEKTPSFHVNPDKGFFHCFGCGVGGDVFKFLEMHEKVAFPEAVRLVAQKLGVALPEMESSGDEARQDSALRETLLKIHEIASAYFREQLAGPAGAHARAQLTDRGLTAETIERLGLGYAAPLRDGLRSRLLKQGFADAVLVQSGVVVQRENGERVDRFRNRLMIPIYRDSGSVIAFGGRAMEAGQVPKYLNSPETPIYSKGRTLYGLNLTKAAIAKLGFAVMVEGYFDFAQVYQSQAAPAVASCGTALTPQQAHLLRRFTTKIVLSYDPDTAGESATVRSCDLLVAEGFDVNVVVLDRGEDPDTFIRRHGPDAYRARLKRSRPYLEHLLDQAASGVDLNQDERRRDFLARMLTIAARIPDAVARDQFADRIAHKARITEDVVRAEIRKAAAAKKTTISTPAQQPGLGHIRDSERALIWWILNSPAEAARALKEVEDADLEGLATGALLQAARGVESARPEGLPSALFGRLSTRDAQTVARIASEKAPPALLVAECVKSLKLIRWEREKAQLQSEIDRLQQLGPRADHEVDDLLDRKNELAIRIEELR